MNKSLHTFAGLGKKYKTERKVLPCRSRPEKLPSCTYVHHPIVLAMKVLHREESEGMRERQSRTYATAEYFPNEK